MSDRRKNLGTSSWWRSLKTQKNLCSMSTPAWTVLKIMGQEFSSGTSTWTQRSQQVSSETSVSSSRTVGLEETGTVRNLMFRTSISRTSGTSIRPGGRTPKAGAILHLIRGLTMTKRLRISLLNKNSVLDAHSPGSLAFTLMRILSTMKTEPFD